MKLAFRYVLILILLVFLALCYYRHRWKYDHSSRWRRSLPQTYSGTYQKHQPPSMPIPLPEFLQDHNKCRMETCFNFTKCSSRHLYSSKHVYFVLYGTVSRYTIVRVVVGAPDKIRFHANELTNHFCNCLKEIIPH